MNRTEKIELKICGLTQAEDIVALASYGVDWLGFNFYQGSKRFIQPIQAAKIYEVAAQINTDFPGIYKMQFHSEDAFKLRRQNLPKIAAVMVDPQDSLIDEVVHLFPMLSALQLHGNETCARIEQIRSRVKKDCQIWKALGIAKKSDLTNAVEYQDLADLILFDSAIMLPGQGAFGGSGAGFSWDWLKTFVPRQKFGVAGGISENNIQEALKIKAGSYSPSLIDVASGAEGGQPGRKEIGKIQALSEAIANHTIEAL